jgi:hypothetical protein
LNLFAWLQSRKEAARLVQVDANALIARFGDNAYFEARDRAQRSSVIDSDRPRWHWARVKIEIAKRQGIEIGRSGADRRT